MWIDHPLNGIHIKIHTDDVPILYLLMGHNVIVFKTSGRYLKRIPTGPHSFIYYNNWNYCCEQALF